MIDGFDLVGIMAIVFISWIIVIGALNGVESAIRDLTEVIRENKTTKTN